MKLYICGDIQGKLKELTWEVAVREKITDSYIIVAGNIGAGSPGFDELYKDKLESRLSEGNIKILSVRGNQDDPSWFDGKHDLEYIKFLEDHKQIEISGKTIYPVGGSISINRLELVKKNEELQKRGSKKKVYWKEEDIVRKKKDLPVKSNIIVTHEAPISFKPVIIRNLDEELPVYEDILSTRKYLDTFLQEINIDSWYFGKYCKSYSGYYGKTLYHSLGELELCEVC